MTIKKKIACGCNQGVTEFSLTWVILGDPRHKVDRREITVETEADCFEVSGVDDGAPGAAAAAPGAVWGAAPAQTGINHSISHNMCSKVQQTIIYKTTVMSNILPDCTETHQQGVLAGEWQGSAGPGGPGPAPDEWSDPPGWQSSAGLHQQHAGPVAHRKLWIVYNI